MDLAKFALEKRLVSALATIFILLGGWYAYQTLPRFEDPEFIIREAQIITPYPGASAEEVAEEVTEVIEDALQQLQGVKEITSVSSSGLSEVTVEFTIQSTPTRDALIQRFTQMRAKISDVQIELPPNALESQVFDDYGDVYALYYAITGEGFSLPDLYEYAKDLQRELVLIDGVSKVVLNGVPEQVIYVEYSPARLFELGLSSDAVAEVLRGQNLVTSAGTVLSGDMRLNVRPVAAVGSVEAIENLVITDPQSGRLFRLSDIATVSRGLREPASSLLFRDGMPAIGIGISNSIGGNVVNMGDAVRERIQELEVERPIGIDLTPISDQSVLVRESVNGFVMNVVLALVIVVGTLLVFMGLRSGILMGGILLVTVAGTLIGMSVFGLDMQRVSLGALIIALGMLVDNAIVVVEGTLVRVQRGEETAKAVRAVVARTRWPLLGGTIVGFTAFSAIGLSPDDTGEYAGSLFWTIAIALLFSWLVAIWLTPYYCTLLMKPKPRTSDEPPREHWILVGYRRLLGVAIMRRWWTIGLVSLLFAGAIASSSLVPLGFFPNSTRASFVIDYTLPQGTDIERTRADMLDIAEWVRGLDGVAATNTTVGASHLRFMLTYLVESPSSSYGQVLVEVDDFERIGDLLDTIRHHLDENYPEAVSRPWRFVLGPGGGALIQARFTGPDPAILRDLSAQAREILNSAGAISVSDTWREQFTTLRPVLNIENARRLGLTRADVSRAIAGQFDGTTIGVYRERDELRPIIMRPFAADRSNIADAQDVQIYSPLAEQYVPIRQVVDDFEIVFEEGSLDRVDRSLAITTEANPPPGVRASDLFQRIQPAIEAIELPPGYTLTWKGEHGDSEEANAGLASTMPFGFGAMVIVVFVLFNAVRQPLIIWLTVPLALIGVIFGLAATQTPLEFIAILAVLSLTGMLIKNAIVLIDETDIQIASGKNPLLAVTDAAVSRVRPVCLGALTTVLGVAPLLWDPFFNSLSVVIIFGLTFATLLTLVVVPVLYVVFFRIRSRP